jgi:guanylate kinase
MYAPPETPEIAARLTHRLDDTEEKVKLRLQTHKANVAAVTDSYKDVITHVSFFIQTCLLLHLAITEVKIFN